MKIIRSPQELVQWRRKVAHGKTIGFVPTMGALHEGHLSLVKQAKQNKDNILVASIFVNPTQFGPKEDLSRYPRPFERDVALLRKAGVHILFAPRVQDVYRSQHATRVEVRRLTNTLCGAPSSRGPEHFVGVATVVVKLFNWVRPQNAYFGMKDFQQVRVIEQMVDDLNFDVRVVRCPTVRESDGLAMSSRNAYLSPIDRTVAPILYHALQHGRKLLTSARSREKKYFNIGPIRKRIKAFLTREPRVRIDYIELVDAQTLEKMKTLIKGQTLIAGAIRIGKTRLIDNILV